MSSSANSTATAVDKPTSGDRATPDRPTNPAEKGKRTISAAASLVDLSTDDLPKEGSITMDQYSKERSNVKKMRLSGVNKARAAAESEAEASSKRAAPNKPVQPSKKKKKKKDKADEAEEAADTVGAGDEAATPAADDGGAEEAEADKPAEVKASKDADPAATKARKVSHHCPPMHMLAPAHASACEHSSTHMGTICMFHTKMESVGFCLTILGGGTPTTNGSTVGAPSKVRLLGVTLILGQKFMLVVFCTPGTDTESQISGIQGHSIEAALQPPLYGRSKSFKAPTAAF